MPTLKRTAIPNKVSVNMFNLMQWMKIRLEVSLTLTLVKYKTANLYVRER